MGLTKTHPPLMMWFTNSIGVLHPNLVAFSKMRIFSLKRLYLLLVLLVRNQGELPVLILALSNSPLPDRWGPAHLTTLYLYLMRHSHGRVEPAIFRG